MAAAVQRKAIEADRHRFTLRQTRRTVLMTFSTMYITSFHCAAEFGRYRGIADFGERSRRQKLAR